MVRLSLIGFHLSSGKAFVLGSVGETSIHLLTCKMSVGKMT